MQRKKLRLILTIAEVCLLACLFGFVWLLLRFGTETQLINSIGLQRTRIERMTKDVLLLRYYRNTSYYTTSVAEIQDTLPLWQSTESALQNGDTAQGLPPHVPTDILNVVSQTQFDYIPLNVALQKIVLHPTQIDDTQVQIILDHRNGYTISISLILSMWDNDIQSVFLQLFWIKAVLIALLLVLVLASFYFSFDKTKLDPGTENTRI